MSLYWLLSGLALGQERLAWRSTEASEPPEEASHRVLAEWDGGTCTQDLGSSGHHLSVKASLGRDTPIERPQDIALLLARLTAQACQEGGYGYTCVEPANSESRTRQLERGQRVNGLLRLPVSRWLTGVTVTLQPEHLLLRYTLYAEGPGPGEEAWAALCIEAQGLVRAALGDAGG